MLGFSVSIKNEAGDSIGHWTDNGDVYTSLVEMVERGHAEEVEIKGGYPNIYRVKNRLLVLLLKYGVSPMTLYGFKLDITHPYDQGDSWATITLWDQS